MEEKLQFTPKPWVVWSEENSDATLFSVCHVSNEENPFEDDGEHRCVASGKGKTTKEAFANACLVSAAPDLLEALEGIIEIGKRDTTNPKYDGYYESAKKAIDKARHR